MPVRGRRATYPAVTFTVVVLVAVNVFAQCGKRWIPPPESGPLSASTGPFMRQAAQQRIAWRRLDSEAIAEAKRRDQPILLVIGGGWSQTGRTFDRFSFANPDLADRIRRQFVPVRVDLSENPEWSTAIWPLARPALGIDPAFQIWIFSPDGRLLSWLSRTSAGQPVDADSLGLVLDAGLRAMASDGPNELAMEQISEVQALLQPRTHAVPDVRNYVLRRLAAVPPEGGLPDRGIQRLHPWEWRLMLAAGESHAVDSALHHVLTSALVDWREGGFFRQAGGQDWEPIEADKLLVLNADMAALLAIRARETGSEEFAVIARRTAKFVADFALGRPGPAAFVALDPDEVKRYEGLSLPVRQMRELYGQSDRGVLRTELSLVAEQNPQMIPRARDWRAIASRLSLYEALLKRMPDRTAIIGGEAELDSMSVASARLAEAGRLLGDEHAIQASRRLYEQCLLLRVGLDDVSHSSIGPGRAHRYLGDYLGFAEAALWQHIMAGDGQALRDGVAVLRRGLFLYGSASPGVVINGAPVSRWTGELRADVPQLVDPERMGTLAQAMRLCAAYGLILGDSDLFSRADAIRLAHGHAANGLTGSVAGFFLASMEVERGRALLVVGSGSEDLAALVARRNPHLLVAPATGTDRRDLAGVADGSVIEVQAPLGRA